MVEAATGTNDDPEVNKLVLLLCVQTSREIEQDEEEQRLGDVYESVEYPCSVHLLSYCLIIDEGSIFSLHTTFF